MTLVGPLWESRSLGSGRVSPHPWAGFTRSAGGCPLPLRSPSQAVGSSMSGRRWQSSSCHPCFCLAGWADLQLTGVPALVWSSNYALVSVLVTAWLWWRVRVPTVSQRGSRWAFDRIGQSAGPDLVTPTAKTERPASLLCLWTRVSAVQTRVRTRLAVGPYSLSEEATRGALASVEQPHARGEGNTAPKK